MLKKCWIPESLFCRSVTKVEDSGVMTLAVVGGRLRRKAARNLWVLHVIVMQLPSSSKEHSARIADGTRYKPSSPTSVQPVRLH